VNVIGLGKPGCSVALEFEKYSQYRVFYADCEDNNYPKFLKIIEQDGHENYEKKYKKLNLSKCKGPTTLILSGAGNISGSVLRLLEQIKENEVTVLYIKPSPGDLGEQARIRDRVTFGVLQQYARSGLLRGLYVVDNKMVETVLDKISIANYWKDINNVISSTYHMLSVFENTEPILTNLPPVPTTSRIGTFGVMNFDNFNQRKFYSLESPRSKRYFFGVNEETLKEGSDLLTKIRSFAEDNKEDKVDSGFAIYQTSYDHNYAYCVEYATLIQEEKLIS
tara:strand:+ start:9804 stop:10640 length:837 start_codon:yes stop_codon:yes gene_type:complete